MWLKNTVPSGFYLIKNIYSMFNIFSWKCWLRKLHFVDLVDQSYILLIFSEYYFIYNFWKNIPGVYNYQVEDDIGKLKSCLNSFLQEYGLPVTVKDDYVHEL